MRYVHIPVILSNQAMTLVAWMSVAADDPPYALTVKELLAGYTIAMSDEQEDWFEYFNPSGAANDLPQGVRL